MTLEYRAFTPELEIRSSAKGGDGRTIEGIAVPYGVPMKIDANLTEQFRMGSAGNLPRAPWRMRFSREHLVLGGELIGVATELRDDDPAGLIGAWRVSKTRTGDETLALVADGALRELSVAFEPRTDARLAGGITERVLVRYEEVAVVLAGAYGDLAVATNIRTAGTEIPTQPGPHERERIEIRRGVPILTTPNLDRAAALLASLPALPPLPAQVR